MILTVNYHYFRDPENSEFPGIHGVNQKRFNDQIKFLRKNFKFLDLNNIVESINSSEIFCLITFDDGLKEQFVKALPILKQYNASAIFNVNGYYIKNKKVSLVHKIHWLRSLTPEIVFINDLNRKMIEMNIEHDLKIEDFAPKEAQNIYDSPEIKYIKFLLNHYLSDQKKKILINSMYNEKCDDESFHSESLYMSEEMLKELSSHNFLGSHGWTHTPKTSLKDKDLFNDFMKNQNYLKKLTGKFTDFVSYPYGGRTAVSRKTASIAEHANHKYGFTIERAISSKIDSKLLLPRFDANDIPHGKNPLLKFEKNRVLSINNESIASRWFSS